MQSSLDHVVAMELWWRSAALQALLACISGPLAAAPRGQQPALLRRAAALLKPTLDVLTAHAALQVESVGLGQPAVMLPARQSSCLRSLRACCPTVAHAQAVPCLPASTKQEPARGKGGPAGMFAGAAALLQLRLLEAYAALPSPAAYADEQEALTKLCMRTVR